jgi:hypothetical protein
VAVIKPVRRSVVWLKEAGAELADVELAEGRLTAIGTAIGADPVPYRLSYTLLTGDNYVTRSLRVRSTGAGWRRSLELHRDDVGEWQATADSEGELAGPAPGGDLALYRGAFDCDLGLSPITNTLPVLRCGLLGGADPVELVLPWVSVPQLAVEPLPQRYTHLVRDAGVSLVRFESEGFSADIVFDSDGIVVDYPGIARRVPSHGG